MVLRIIRDGNQHHSRQPYQSKNWATEFEIKWITDKLEKKAIQFADNFGKELKEKGLSTSQIRNVFGEMRRIQLKGFEKQKTAFLLLKPKIAYATARKSKEKGLPDLKNVFNKAHDAVENEKHFQNFMDFMEAVLAYHKAYGGK